jgi:hypothetical protein
VQNSSKIKDAASKLVISNVILQRIQSHVPISKAVQLQLNMLLFETDTGVSKDGTTGTEDGMTTGVSKDGITSTEDLNETCVQKQDGMTTGVSKDGITSTEDLNETCVQKQDGLSAME